MFKSKIILAAVAMAAIAFGAVAIKVNADAKEIEALTSQVKSLKDEVAIKKSEVAQLADAIEVTAFVNQQLLDERKSIEAISLKYEQEQTRLRTALAQAKSDVDKLKVSEDEYVKSWANAVYPDSAVRLLKYARTGSNHQDSNGDQNGKTDTSFTVASVQHTNRSF